MKAIRERPIKSDAPLKIFWNDEADLDDKLVSVPTHIEVCTVTPVRSYALTYLSTQRKIKLRYRPFALWSRTNTTSERKRRAPLKAALTSLLQVCTLYRIANLTDSSNEEGRSGPS